MNSSHQLKQRNFLLTLNASSRIETYDKFIQVRSNSSKREERILEMKQFWKELIPLQEWEKGVWQGFCVECQEQASKQQYSGEQNSFFHKKIIACSETTTQEWEKNLEKKIFLFLVSFRTLSSCKDWMQQEGLGFRSWTNVRSPGFWGRIGLKGRFNPIAQGKRGRILRRKARLSFFILRSVRI